MGAEPGGLFAGKRDVCGAGREDYYSRSTLSKFDVFISNDWSDTNVGLFVLKGTSLYIANCMSFRPTKISTQKC